MQLLFICSLFNNIFLVTQTNSVWSDYAMWYSVLCMSNMNNKILSLTNILIIFAIHFLSYSSMRYIQFYSWAQWWSFEQYFLLCWIPQQRDHAQDLGYFLDSTFLCWYTDMMCYVQHIP
jgi:hypothetical protein